MVTPSLANSSARSCWSKGRRFVSYAQGVKLYKMKYWPFVRLAQQAESNYPIRKTAIVAFLLKKRLYEFTPIEVSKMLGVTNKTIINRCAKLVNNGLLIMRVSQNHQIR